MAAKKQARLSADVVGKDNSAYIALQSFSDYNPNNADFTMAKVTAASDAMVKSRTAEKNAEDAAAAARDNSAKAEHAFHDIMQGATNQVKSQYGESSDQLAAMGLKKKEEYKRPAGRPKKSA